MSLTEFVVFPPGHGRSVTDFSGWDAHEERLRCPDDVSGDIGGCSARRALKLKFEYPTQTMVTAGILPFRENSHGRTANRIRDLMISRQRLWPLDREAGRNSQYLRSYNYDGFLSNLLKLSHIDQVFTAYNIWRNIQEMFSALG